jgi:acetyl esterase/lipase
MNAINPELEKRFSRLPKFVLGGLTTRIMRLVTPLLLPKVDIGSTTVEEVPTPSSSKTMRIYRRANAAPSLPVVLWIHGGGYIAGTNKTEDRWGVAFTEQFDCAVVAAGYRLAPENPFPAALDDLAAAVAWVTTHGAEHGLDASRICIAGESGGGGLAAALVQRLFDEGVAVTSQLLVYPMIDDRTTVRSDIGRKEHLGWSNGSNHYGWSSYLGTAPGGETTPPYAVPARRTDLSGLPPTWIGVGDMDVFYDESVEYARRLAEAGVRCQLEEALGAPHGFPSLVPEAAISKKFMASALTFTEASLSGPQAD